VVIWVLLPADIGEFLISSGLGLISGGDPVRRAHFVDLNAQTL
jgi:hypothetical protein